MFKPRKVAWSDEGSRGLHEGGGNCLKYLERECNRKEGRGNKGFKKGGQTGSRCGCLKKGVNVVNKINGKLKFLYTKGNSQKSFT